jgi:hypothetical protein
MNTISLNSVRSYLPSLQLASPMQMASNAAKIAIPAILMAGAMYAKQAEAGPIAYASCMAICLGATLGGFAPACAVACAPALAAPTP